MNAPAPRAKAHILSVASFGFINGPDDMHSGAVGSRLRIDHAAELVANGTIPKKDLIAIFPQAMWPKGVPHDLDHSLAAMMTDYMESLPVMSGTTFVTRAMGVGTLADIKNTYTTVCDLGHECAHIYFVSDPAHIRRIKLIWWLTKPPGWTASFHEAIAHRRSFTQRWIYEPLAIGKLFLSHLRGM